MVEATPSYLGVRGRELSWNREAAVCFHVFRTVTAGLSLDFSDDAVVERGVTESILKEFCQETNTF